MRDFTADSPFDLLQFRAASRDSLINSKPFQFLAGGGLTRDVSIRFLLNVFHYGRHIPKIVGLAVSRCVESSPSVAISLLIHMQEYVRRDYSAYSDFTQLCISDDRIDESEPGTACTAIIGSGYFFARHYNPVALLGLLIILEIFEAEMGKLIAEKLGQEVSFVKESVSTLDVDSMTDTDWPAADPVSVNTMDFMLREIAPDTSNLREFLHVARISIDLYSRILLEAIGDQEMPRI